MRRALSLCVILVGCPRESGDQKPAPPIAAPPPTPPLASSSVTAAPAPATCRAIDTELDWTKLASLVGKRLTNDAMLCRGRADCCRVAERLTTTPASSRRVVKLDLLPRAENARCVMDGGPHPNAEYWLVETRPDGVASSVRLLVASHYAPYSPERGELDGAGAFVWSHQETCYGHGAMSGCTPGGWSETGRIALAPSPHVLGQDTMCPGTLPLMVSADW
jgi:hypothetical protein